MSHTKMNASTVQRNSGASAMRIATLRMGLLMENKYREGSRAGSVTLTGSGASIVVMPRPAMTEFADACMLGSASISPPIDAACDEDDTSASDEWCDESEGMPGRGASGESVGRPGSGESAGNNGDDDPLVVTLFPAKPGSGREGRGGA